MIKTVVREYKWLPKQIGSLFIDAQDYLGIEFWYNDSVEVHKELEPKINPKGKRK
jgi:hypothetical protein